MFDRNSEQKRAETRSRYGATDALSFPPVSDVPCVSASHSSAFPVPLLQIRLAAYVTFNIYNAYILKQRSIRATSEMHLFPAKVGAKYAPCPT